MNEPQVAEPADDEISLLDLLQVVADNLRLLIIGPLLAGLAALGIAFAIAPTYTATVRFLPPQQQQSAAASMLASLGALGGLAGAVAVFGAGLPELPGCIAVIDCTTHSQIELGDHYMVVGHVQTLDHVDDAGDAMAFYKGKVTRAVAVK